MRVALHNSAHAEYDTPAACGKTATGFTAAMSQLAFGSPPGSGAGDACGRCFKLTGTKDPYSPNFTGPFYNVVVKTTDLCPVQGNQVWCGQNTTNPVNSFGTSVQCVLALPTTCVSWRGSIKKISRSFDLCQDSGAANAFFPSGHGALTGTYEEVSCSEWSGTDGSSLWNGACLNDENSPSWPSTGSCGNKGTELSLPNSRNALVHVYCRHCTINKWSDKTKMSY